MSFAVQHFAHGSRLTHAEKGVVGIPLIDEETEVTG